MFINCPHCQALIATDPATDLPPVKCPRCAAGLRETTATNAPASISPETPAVDATPSTGVHATAPPATSVVEPLDTRPAEEPGTTVGQTRADLPAAIAAAISPVAPPLKPATQVPAKSPATVSTPAQGAPAPEPVVEDNSTAAPTPGNEAIAAPAPAGEAATTSQTPTGHKAAEAVVPETATDIADADAPAPESPTGGDTALPATSAPEAAPRAAEAARVLPSFARTGPLPHHGFGWKTATAAAALALLLLLQLLLAGRAQLADDARWRPLVSTLCSAFGCTLPPWREPAAFTVLARDVRPHPSLPGVLRVTATLRNDARWPQPWPRLRLTLSDVDGNPVAARDFAAREYLGARSPPPQIASGQVAAFAMDIVEPASRSVAFDFELH